MHYLPRLTFSLFIQLFSFFFLQQYKSNLNDAKYFQNELTNVNSKLSAIKMAILLKKEDQFELLIKDLSSVERNFKLGKDESMYFLKKAEFEKDLDLEFMSTIKESILKDYINTKKGKTDAV